MDINSLEFVYKKPVALKPSDVYSAHQLMVITSALLKDYQIIGFDIPKKGDLMICRPWGDHINPSVVTSTSGWCSEEAPRLIVKPRPKRKVYTFKETGETRIPLNGEWFKEGNNLNYARCDFTFSRYPIVELVSVTEE